MSEFDDAGRIPLAVHQVGLDPKVQKQWNERWDNLDWLKRHLAVLRQNLRTITDAGVLVLMGSDTSESGTGTLLGLCSQVELKLMVEAGLSPLEALQAATLNPARMLQRESDLGSLEAGKIADILLLNANPMEDISNVRNIFRVIKSGRVYDPADSEACNAIAIQGGSRGRGDETATVFADLAILDANPLDDIRNVHHIHRVMRGRVLHDPKELLRAAN
jgi:imidazolonepropionase-like amidohydrolase